MEEEVKGIKDYLDILWRRKYWVIIPAVFLLVLTVLITFSLPASYKSEGLILIETQEIPQDLVRTTVTSYADQRIEVIKQRLMTTSRAMEIIRKHNLYVEERSKTPQTAPIVGLFRQNMGVDIVQANVTDPVSGRAKQASIAFSVSFMDRSPQKAQQVADELVTQFLSENISSRTERAADTTEFLRMEGDRLQKEVQLKEKEIAEFRDENSDSLPDLLEYNLAMVQNTQEEISKLENQAMVLSDQLTTMGLQLSMISRDNPMGAYESGRPSSAMMSLQQLRSEYLSMQSRYSENHPDLLRVKRELIALETEMGGSLSGRAELEEQQAVAQQQLQSLSQRYSAEHPDVKAAKAELNRLQRRLAEAPEETQAAANAATTNPVYVEIKAKMDATAREIERLKERQQDLRGKLVEYEERVYKTNQVKRAYQDLTRDYENKLKKYQEIRAKQLEAQLAQTLESENKGESFQLIEPPQVPQNAEKPNRPKLLAAGLVASTGAGVGMGFLIETLFGGIRGYTNIAKIVGKAPLVVIPVIPTEQQRKRHKTIRNRLIILFLLVLLSVILAFHFYVMNLEVLWFKVLNTINLL